MDSHKISYQIVEGNLELSDSPVVRSDFYDVVLCFFDFVTHLGGEFPHLTSFVGEEIDLVFCVGYFLLGSGVLGLLFLHLCCDLLDGVVVISSVLLDLLGM